MDLTPLYELRERLRAGAIAGAALAPGLLRLLGISDPMAQGVAIGTASHGIGTARALELGKVQGAMSGVAVGVAGIITVLLLTFL